MFEKIGNFFNKMIKPEVKELTSKDAAKERLHLVLMQDRANVSVDFLELMKQEIIDVIKKYIVIDESSIDVRLTNKENEDGTTGAPSLYANIPILNIKNDVKAEKIKDGTLIYENGELEKTPETVSEQVIEVGPIQETANVVEQIENAIEEITEEIPEVKVQVTHVVDDDIEGLDDEDIEDVTFDDLLKKAEEEEAIEPIVKFAEEEKESEDEPEEVESTTITVDNTVDEVEVEQSIENDRTDKIGADVETIEPEIVGLEEKVENESIEPESVETEAEKEETTEPEEVDKTVEAEEVSDQEEVVETEITENIEDIKEEKEDIIEESETEEETVTEKEEEKAEVEEPVEENTVSIETAEKTEDVEEVNVEEKKEYKEDEIANESSETTESTEPDETSKVEEAVTEEEEKSAEKKNNKKKKSGGKKKKR